MAVVSYRRTAVKQVEKETGRLAKGVSGAFPDTASAIISISREPQRPTGIGSNYRVSYLRSLVQLGQIPTGRGCMVGYVLAMWGLVVPADSWKHRG